MHFKRTTLVSLFLAATLGGLLFAKFGWRLSPWWLPAPLILFSKPLRRSKILVPGLILTGLAIGLIRGNVALKSERAVQGLVGQKVSLVGRIADDPTQPETKSYASFSLNNPRLSGRTLPGHFYIISYDTKLRRSEQVAVYGKLRPGFGSFQAELIASTTQVLDRRVSWLEQLRRSFFVGMQTALPEPLGGLAIGLLVGSKSLLPKTLQAELTAVGLAHLIAVSGYNLTIIVNAVRNLLRRGSKFMRTAVSGWLIAGFVIVSGASPSILRAAVVAGLMLAADYYGRAVRPLVLILLAAAATAFINPENLWRDVGWQLSFLAFFGILVIAPIFTAKLHGRAIFLKQIALESLAAQIMTLPLILVVFGQLSVVSPLANLLILPLVPLAMLFSMIAGLAGMLWPLGSGWLGWPALILLEVMLSVVGILHQPHWASLQLTAAWPAAVAIYACFVACLLMRQWSNGRNLKQFSIIEGDK